jgi:hypothetical protein
MELEILGKKELAVVPDNMYLATISRVQEAEYEYGKVLIIGFKIEAGQYTGVEVNGLCKAIVSPQSKLYSWCEALGLKLVEGQRLETNSLIGLKCRVLTKTRVLSKPVGELPGKVSNVDKVFPPQ